MPYSTCMRCNNCDGFPCMVHAKSDAEVLGVRPALEYANVTLMTERRGGQARVQTPPDRGDRCRRRTRRRDGDAQRDIVVVMRRRELRQAAADLSQRRSIRTASPTAPIRSAATTCSTTARRCWRSRWRTNPTVFQKTLGLNDFYFSGGEDFEFPLGNIQMVGKSQAPMFRGEKPGETRFAPNWSLRGRRATRGGLLAVDRGPAAARQPRHARRRRQRSQSATRRPTTGPRSGSTSSSSRCWGTSACITATCFRITPT